MKKKKSRLVTAGIIIGMLLAGAAALYFLLPGLHKPIDLGVQSSSDTYGSAAKKFSDAKVLASDQKNNAVSVSLTSEEITSLINKNPSGSDKMKDFQARINPDDTMEVSATVSTSYVMSDVLEGRYSMDDVQEAYPMLGVLPEELNFYCKVDQETKNDQVTDFKLEDINVMGITLPDSLISSGEASKLMVNVMDTILEDVPEGSDIDFSSIRLENGQLTLSGETQP